MREIEADPVNEAIEKLGLWCLQNNQNMLNTDFQKTVTANNGNQYRVYLHFQIQPVENPKGENQ